MHEQRQKDKRYGNSRCIYTFVFMLFKHLQFATTYYYDLAPYRAIHLTGVCFRIVGRGKCGWTALQQQRSPAQQSLPNDDATAALSVTAGPMMATTTPSGVLTAQGSVAAAAAATDTKIVALQYAGKEVYLDETVYLVGSKNGKGFVLLGLHICFMIQSVLQEFVLCHP